MKTQKMIVIAAIVCLMVGASGPAQALSQEAREIIGDFCEKIREDAEETGDKLTDADESLGRCVNDFADCREGGGIGDGDPLVECLSDGLGCAGRDRREGGSVPRVPGGVFEGLLTGLERSSFRGR